ncbi:hypothetical protein HMPREF0975_02928, partial [Actinomyces sp. oral taxon 849 str. F0330]
LLPPAGVRDRPASCREHAGAPRRSGRGPLEDLPPFLAQGRGPVLAPCRRPVPMKTSMSSISISPAASRSSRYGVSQWTTGPAPTPAKDLTLDGSFPLSAVTSARLLRVTTPPGSSKDRGKTSCPQQLAQPRTTRDHQQGNGSSPVSPPASSGWDASDLLDVQVDHVAREAGQDGFAGPVGLSGGIGGRAVGSDRLCPASGSRCVPTPLSRARRARG